MKISFFDLCYFTTKQCTWHLAVSEWGGDNDSKNEDFPMDNFWTARLICSNWLG